MKSPNVSVIIPVYNGARFLKKAVESALGQTYADLEIIIIDDGSIDGTPDVIDRLKQSSSNVRSERIAHSGGAAKPKNVGISLARGRYIATLDADDVWHSEKIQKQIELLEGTDSSIGYATCYSIYEFEEEGVRYVHKVPVCDKKQLETVLSRDVMGSGSGMLYKKEVFETVGGFDEELRSGQDAEMRIRLVQTYTYVVVPEVLFTYYFHAKNITTERGIEGRMKDIQYIMEKWNMLYEEYPHAKSNRLRYNGTSFMIAGDTTKARQSFLASLQFNPLNVRSYFYFLLSFLGSRIYKKLTFMKASRI